MASGKIQTVLGPINPEDLGITMAHEHLSMTFDVAYVPPPKGMEGMSECPFTIENLGWIRQYPHKENLQLCGSEVVEAVKKDLEQYKALGGQGIVECTTHGLQRKAGLLRDLSRETGIHIIAGTGFYVAGAQRMDVLNRPMEVLVKLMATELQTGCIDAADVKCGILGEIGTSWPLHDFEKCVLEAAAQVQRIVGCPVMFGPGPHHEAPLEIVRLFQEAGGDASKASMAHLECTIQDEGQLSEFAELGTYMQFDLFGMESSQYQPNEAVDMPSDAQRIQRLWQLVDEGFEKQILVSHNISTRHRLRAFGGHGYGHIMQNLVPRMQNRGLSQAIIDLILKDNPRDFLTFKDL